MSAAAQSRRAARSRSLADAECAGAGSPESSHAARASGIEPMLPERPLPCIKQAQQRSQCVLGTQQNFLDRDRKSKCLSIQPNNTDHSLRTAAHSKSTLQSLSPALVAATNSRHGGAVAAIVLVTQQRAANVVRVHTYLVRPPGAQAPLHECRSAISQFFKHPAHIGGAFHSEASGTRTCGAQWFPTAEASHTWCRGLHRRSAQNSAQATSCRACTCTS